MYSSRHESGIWVELSNSNLKILYSFWSFFSFLYYIKKKILQKKDLYIVICKSLLCNVFTTRNQLTNKSKSVVKNTRYNGFLLTRKKKPFWFNPILINTYVINSKRSLSNEVKGPLRSKKKRKLVFFFLNLLRLKYYLIKSILMLIKINNGSLMKIKDEWVYIVEYTESQVKVI